MEESDPRNKYRFLTPAIGCDVYKVIRIVDEKEFCLKHSQKIDDNVQLQLYINEYNSIKNINHTNIIKVYEAFLFDNIFSIVMEFADDGDLTSIVGKLKNEADILRICSQIVEGLYCLHKKNIIHRDLEPGNILKFKNGIVKIAAFGFTENFKQSFVLKHMNAGTDQFIAPEIITIAERNIGKPTNIWSLGVCLYYLVEGKLPFRGSNSNEIISQIIYENPFPFEKNITQTLQSLIFLMLNKKEQDRITITQIFETIQQSYSNLSFLSQNSEFSSFQKILVQQKNLLCQNIFVFDFPIHKIVYKNFSYLYLFDEKYQDVQKLSFFDTQNTSCILFLGEMKILPDRYFFDNPRIKEKAEQELDFIDIREKIPLSGFSLNLKKIFLFSAILKIDVLCFCGCESLTEIRLPPSITEINFGCFFYCKSLTKINLPASLKKIGDQCFASCESLTEIYLPQSIITIGSLSFAGCYQLNRINIPGSVKKLPELCFYLCKSLSEIHLPQSITEIGNRCFLECSQLNRIKLPASLEKIGDQCFANCESLTEIYLPQSIITIGFKCFAECISLQNVCGKISLIFGGNAFEDCPFSE